jgi:hypothetical protein
MTKELKTIDLNLLPIETLKEMANEAAEQVENNAKLTVQKAADCGRYLTAIKEQLEHGEWLPWLGANWDYSPSTAVRYMDIAANSSRVTNLKDASSIREALRMIADDKEEKKVPRSERKPATVVVSVPDDHVVDANKMVDKQPDNDPTPDPPTIRRTAKGSQKVSEDKKPRTQQVPVEIVPDEPDEPDEKTLADFCEHEILEYLVATADDAKRRAKALRKAADKLDPPTKFVKPDLSDVAAFFAELKAPEPESFFDFYESKGWLVGKVSMKDWRASARKWVRENANGGHNNGAAHRGTGQRGYTADEVFS